MKHEMLNSSPSNIKLGWGQKFFYKLESDSMLNTLIRIFTENGNEWTMKTETFKKIVAKDKTDGHYKFVPVCDYVLEDNGDNIRFRDCVAEELLQYSYRWSLKNELKKLKRKFKQK